jgi:hypothetical protein
MPGKMDYYVYKANDDTLYSVKIRKYYFTVQNEANDAPALKFGAQDLSKPLMPRGMRMRKIYVQDPTGGSRRAIPCGDQTAPAWDGTDTTLKMDYSGISGTATFNIINTVGEHSPQRQHAVTQQSDAA